MSRGMVADLTGRRYMGGEKVVLHTIDGKRTTAKIHAMIPAAQPAWTEVLVWFDDDRYNPKVDEEHVGPRTLYLAALQKAEVR